MQGRYKCRDRCLFKCDDLATYYTCMHSFPNPKTKPDLYEAWASAVGASGGNLARKRLRLCDHHFARSDKLATRNLMPWAVPVYFERISQSIVTVVALDHNYATLLRGLDPSEVPQQVDKGKIRPQTTDERLYKGEPHFDHDHTYVVPPKLISEPFGARVTGKPEDTQIKPPTKIDLVPKVSGETHTLGVSDGVLVDDVIDNDVITDDALSDDFTADDVPDRDPSPVPEVKVPEEKSLFSWQKTELIEADDPDDPPVPVSPPPADPTLALTCDPDPGAATQDQTVPTQPASAEKDVENRCKDCGEINEGFQFWCVECSRGALCGACAGRPPHRRHHVLRAPMHADKAQTRAVLMVIRQQLQNENLLSPHETLDDGLKVEVKEEPPDAPPAAPEEPPAEPDPLACEPHAALDSTANEHQCMAEQIVDHPQPLKLTQLPVAHAHREKLILGTQRKLVKVSTTEVKRAFLSHLDRIVTTQQQVKGPQTISQACKENLITQHIKAREYQLLKSTSQTAGDFTGITRTIQARTQVPIKVTSEPKPSETVIIDLDGDEYLEEGLDRDIETVEEVVLDDNETNEDDNLVTNDDDALDDRETNEDDALDDRETNEDDALDDRDTNEDDALDDRDTNEEDALDDRETNEDDGLDDRETNEDDVLDDRETNEDDALDDRETNEDDALDDRESNDDDALDDRETNEDYDGLDDRDDDVLDEDYLVDEDDLSEDDESDEDTIGHLARKGVKRKIDAKQTLPMSGSSKSITREDAQYEDEYDYLIEDSLIEEDPLVDIAGRGVKRKEDAQETSPVSGPCSSMAQALPSKAVVQVRPLSSLEITNWTADRKRQRKY